MSRLRWVLDSQTGYFSFSIIIYFWWKKETIFDLFHENINCLVIKAYDWAKKSDKYQKIERINVYVHLQNLSSHTKGQSC